MEKYFTYILQSETSGRFYIGHTESIELRLKRHNSGLVTSTRNKGPWKVVYTEIFNSKIEANRREFEIKKKKSRNYILNLLTVSKDKVNSE